MFTHTLSVRLFFKMGPIYNKKVESESFAYIEALRVDQPKTAHGKFSH